MPKISFSRVLIFFLCAVIFLSARAELEIFTEDDVPPLNYVKDGKLEGVSVELVREIQRRIGDTATINVVPWARGYANALGKADVALFTTTKTEQREKLFKWVGPLAKRQFVFVTKKDSPVIIKSLDDAKKLGRIGVYNAASGEQFLQSLGFQNLNSTIDEISNVRKLGADRLDAWYTGNELLHDSIEKAGYKPDAFVVKFVGQSLSMYIVFSLKTDDAIVEKWQSALDAMRKDGTYNAIYKKYNLIPPPAD